MRALKIAFLRVAKSLGLFALARRLTRHRLRILCYHGMAVADQAQFRPYLFLSPQIFRQRIDFLARAGWRVLDLDTAVRRLYDGTLPADSVAITVDDGFSNFHELAVPVLRAAGFPATIYVTTYHVRHATPVFRLLVQYLFWKTAQTRLARHDFPFLVGADADLTDPAQKERLLQRIVEHGEACASEDERVSLGRALAAALDVSYDDIVRQRLFHLMTPDQLRAAATAGMAIELHTHRHRFPADDEPAAVREIEENRQILRVITGVEARHFCYPSGLWDPRQAPWLDRLDIRSSTTCLPGLNSAATPRHALRRFLDGDTVHPLEFEAALSGFADLVRAVVRRRA